MQNFTFELDIVKSKSSVQAGDRIVLGYASTFDIDSDHTQITREALEGAKDDLIKYSTVLFNHDTTRPIGKTIETTVDDVGLLVKVKLSKEEDEIWKKIQEGIINKFSIKGRVLDAVLVDSKEQIYQIKEIELFEVSLVSVPANVDAKTISHYIAKTLNMETSNIKHMNGLIEKLKLIQEKSNDEIKEEVGSLIIQLEKERDVIAGLQVVAGKLEETDRNIIEEAIELLKAKQKSPEETDISEATKEFDLTDESETRPVFQLNSEEKDKIEFEENTTKFKKEILKLGKWFHWEADGGVLNVTEEVIDGIIKNFKKNVIEHVSVPLMHTSDPSKNTGEVVSLEKTDTGLEATIEIKDEKISEKIRKGLIRCISASLDPNYRVKKTNKFAGPTLLHAALVTEPYIKGMGNFVALSEDLVGRPIVQLEDVEPNSYSVLKMIKETLTNIEDKTLTEDKISELFFQMPVGDTKTEDDEEKEEVVEKAKDKPGDSCEVDGKKGKYVMVDDKLVCKEMSEEDLKEFAKSEYGTCMSKEMKAGKSLPEAANICKAKIKKELGVEPSEEESEDKSDTESEENAESKVDLVDAEKVYKEYLKEGKVVPAQKEAFIELLTSGRVLELGDKKVGITKLLENFMKSQPKVVNFEENGTNGNDENKEGDVNEKDNDNEEMPKDVKDLYNKMGLSDDQAKESWQYAKDLKTEEDSDKESTVF